MFRSLRIRLTIATILCMAVVLATSGMLIHSLQSEALRTRFDLSLVATAEALLQMVEYKASDGLVRIDDEEIQSRSLAALVKEGAFQIWTDDGKVVYRSPSLQHDLPNDQQPSEDGRVPAIFDTPLKNDPSGRAVAVGVRLSASGDGGDKLPVKRVVLVYARPNDLLERDLSELRQLLITTFAAATVLASAVGVMVVQISLRPAKRLAQFLGGVDVTNLRTTVPANDLPRELRPVGVKLQTLLDRIADAFEREKRFTSAAAHELRTPIAGMRSLVDFARKRSRTPEEHHQILNDLAEVVAHSERLVDRLLTMSRSEKMQVAMEELVQINEVFTALAESYAAEIQGKSLQVRDTLPTPLTIRTDPDLLAIVLGNLMDNAVEHCPAGSTICFAAVTVGNDIQIQVRNARDLDVAIDPMRLFEPFWRGDAARSGTGRHLGLGLSLAQRAAEACGGRIEIELNAKAEFVASLCLPLSKLVAASAAEPVGKEIAARDTGVVKREVDVGTTAAVPVPLVQK